MAIGARPPLPVWLRPPAHICSYTIFEPFPKADYVKVRKLADAIHGKVYLYTYTPTGENCVIKQMENQRVMLANVGLEDARVEIGVHSYLQGNTSGFISAVEHITKLRAIYQDAQYTYIVTEFASGGELFNHVKTRGTFPELEVKTYATQVLLAVAKMHANGIVHRDISLENILLHGDCTVRIVDFGQAVRVWSPTEDGVFMKHVGRASKQYYRSPEMYVGAYEGPPVDVFAIGVLLFIMVVGTPPWDNALPTDQRFRYIETKGLRELINAWRLGHLVSPELTDLMSQMLKKNPAQRITVEAAMAHPWFEGAFE